MSVRAASSLRAAVRPHVVLAIAAVAGIVPLFLARHLPMSDLPEHVAAMATIRHYWDPSWRSQEYFTLARVNETPYWLYHAVGAALSLVTGSAERANLAMMALVGLAYPYGLRSLLVALRRDPRLALFGPALFWTQNLTVGLLNFVASVPLVLFALAEVVRQSRAPTRARSFGLAALSVAILYLHLSSFALFLAQAVVLGVLLPALPRARLANFTARAELLRRMTTLPKRFVWLLPSLACAVSFALAGRAGANHEGKGGIVYQPRLTVLRKLPQWLFDLFRTKTDDVLGWALVAVLVALLVHGLGGRGERWPQAPAGSRLKAVLARVAKLREVRPSWRTWPALALFAVAAVNYFTMPAQVGAYAFLLDVRMSVFFAVFAVLLPAPRRTRSARALHGLSFALSIGLAANAAYEVRAFEREEVGNFDDLLRRMPRGSRLLSLDYAGYSTRANANVLLHYGSYYRARYGGIASFSFSEMPHWPVHYRPEWLPPNPMTWGDPRAFDNARDGDYFDFVLTHGDVLPFAESPPGPEWEIAGVARTFRLYRKVRGSAERARSSSSSSSFPSPSPSSGPP